MPVDRRHNGRMPNVNGEVATHEPGAYEHALEKLCEQDALTASPDYLLVEADEDEKAWDEQKAARKAALMAERDGKPIKVRAHMLPRGLHAPFNRWSQRGMYVVKPDDTITLKPRESRSA